MPVALLERIPLPSLQTYTLLSCSLFSCALYYAHIHTQQFLNQNGQDATTATGDQLQTSGQLPTQQNGDITNDSVAISSTPVRTIEGEGYMTDILNILITETWCVWTFINMAYCCIILLAKLIQKTVFGKLRVSEHQRLKDKFWNFIFYKFIFIFGVMNVQNMDEVICWSAWFTVLGFFHLFAQLCRDRFEYLSFSPTTPNWMHAKVLTLLLVVQVSCFFLTAVCVLIGFHAGLNTFAFMVAECLILSLRTLHVIICYGLHLYDLHHDGVWENRGIYVYYLEFMFEMTVLSIDFMHHVHMLVWGNIFLSMASLVICMQLRFLFHEFQRRWRRHKNYLRVVNSMEARFPLATDEELKNNNDECAICWEKMETARRLECSHLFHNACLRSWLQQEASCPICRATLAESTPPTTENPNNAIPPLAPGAPAPPQPIINMNPRPFNTTNHFFHFDASRYVSWLPSFSVEVSHTLLGTGPQRQRNLVQNSQLDNMARQVQEVFPNLPYEVVIGDLRMTHSVDITIDNIIEGRVTAPQMPVGRASATHTPDSSSSEQAAEEPTPTTQNPPAANTTAVNPPNPGGINLNFNFISDENVPSLNSSDEEGDSEEDEDESSNEEENFSLGGRFSKSSIEREGILSARKESLLAHARRKYLAKHGTEGENLQTSCDDNDAELKESSSAATTVSSVSPLLHSETLPNQQSQDFSNVDVVRRRQHILDAVQRRYPQQ